MNTEQTYIEKLNALCAELDGLKKTDTERLNIFRALGVTRQEIRHSAFLAFLLSPRAPHGLGSTFSEKFVCTLESARNDKNVPQNGDILSAAGIGHDDLIAFARADDLEVMTENVVGNPDSRMDIFMHSESADTLLVIENKTFTSVHDDQLSAYERDAGAYGGKKIFVYLTPNGNIPTDIEGRYQRGWCIMSYTEITDILRGIIPIATENRNIRLKLLAEDYIDMVDADILGKSVKLRELCREIKRKHANALELLNTYTDNAKDCTEYCMEKLRAAIDVTKMRITSKGAEFVTQGIDDLFGRFGETAVVGNKFLCRYIISCEKDIKVFLSLQKNREDEWSTAQKDVLRRLDAKHVGSMYWSDVPVILLRDSERGAPFYEDGSNEISPVILRAADRMTAAVSEKEKFLRE